MELAEQVKLLFGLCATLIPDKEMLKDTYDLASERQSMSLSMAPIFGAFGQNYEDVENEARIKELSDKVKKQKVDEKVAGRGWGTLCSL